MAPVTTSCKLAIAGLRPLLSDVGLLLSVYHQECLAPEAMQPGSLRTDSRLVRPGDIFVAFRGVSADGHAHLAGACANGAAALIGDDPAQLAAAAAAHGDIPIYLVADARQAWAHLAARAHGDPQQHLQLIGVTGTNGKTSTVWMTAELLRSAGHRCLSIGTLGAYFSADDIVATNHTTPDPDLLYALLARAVAEGLRTVVMEVSSHAISQGKLAPLRFAATAFTSFSRDHLDFHGDMAAYLQTKWRLFSQLATPTARQIFAASLATPPNLQQIRGERLVYGPDAAKKAALWSADGFLSVKTRHTDVTGSILEFGGLASKGGEDVVVKVPYFSPHALENYAAATLLAQTAAGRLLPEASATSRPELRCVPGRLELVDEAGQPAVFVDYAHTPDALAKTLAILKPMASGRLLVVFGCGGDRDPGKRPLMGAVAEELADLVFLTSDNPRSEAPEQILVDILAGCTTPAKIYRDTDRRRAIAAAITAARRDDIVLIAGKGHETYQIFADRTLPFDDRQVARQCLQAAQ